MTSHGLERRIYFHSVSFFHDEDVVVLTIQLLLCHVSLVLLHQVSSDFDYIVIVVNVISDKRKSFGFKNSLEIVVVQIVFKNHSVFDCVPDFQINCIFSAFTSVKRTHDE